VIDNIRQNELDHQDTALLRQNRSAVTQDADC
jgi:hypothetical protein